MYWCCTRPPHPLIPLSHPCRPPSRSFPFTSCFVGLWRDTYRNMSNLPVTTNENFSPSSSNHCWLILYRSCVGSQAAQSSWVQQPFCVQKTLLHSNPPYFLSLTTLPPSFLVCSLSPGSRGGGLIQMSCWADHSMVMYV